ncbi:MAG: membrane protease YdiL (CAAX protease family) [Rhodothermales bacterium]|jgi:membrane protease YdiL (CAAX protease family)
MSNPQKTPDAGATKTEGWTIGGSGMNAGSRGGLRGYLGITRTATYGFIAAVPLLLLYEVLILLVNDSTDTAVRVGADVWIKQLIALVGDPGMFAIGLVVLLAGAWVVRRDWKKGLPLRPRYLGWMLLESTLYAILVALIVSRVVGAIFYNVIPADSALALAAGIQGQELGLGKMLALSLGAGLYEELVFRVFLVGGLFWAFKKVSGRGGVSKSGIPAYLLAAFLGALVFSAVHYIGTFGDDFQLASFTFRFLFGLVLNGLYLWRGFGIAAWTHAIYDVLVVTNTL